MKQVRTSPAAKLLLLAVWFVLWMAALARGQTLMAVVSGGYTLPQTAKALVLLGSATNKWQPSGVSWSGTNAIQFTLSQLWSTFGTNESYGGPALMAVEVEDMNGTYSQLTPPTLLDPSKLGTNTVVNFMISNSAPAIVISSPPPQVLNFGWDAVDQRLVLCTSTNVAAPMPNWTIAYVWPANLPTNCAWTNDLAPGVRVFRLGVLTTNGLSLLIDTNHYQFSVTN